MTVKPTMTPKKNEPTSPSNLRIPVPRPLRKARRFSRQLKVLYKLLDYKSHLLRGVHRGAALVSPTIFVSKIVDINSLIIREANLEIMWHKLLLQ